MVEELQDILERSDQEEQKLKITELLLVRFTLCSSLIKELILYLKVRFEEVHLQRITQ